MKKYVEKLQFMKLVKFVAVLNNRKKSTSRSYIPYLLG